MPSFSVRAASIYQINHDASSRHFVARDAVLRRIHGTRIASRAHRAAMATHVNSGVYTKKFHAAVTLHLKLRMGSYSGGQLLLGVEFRDALLFSAADL